MYTALRSMVAQAAHCYFSLIMFCKAYKGIRKEKKKQLRIFFLSFLKKKSVFKMPVE
jgi:hypothetical protein